MKIQEVFDRLWKDYSRQNPSADRIHDLFTSSGEKVVNDHVAFRTVNDHRIGIDALSVVFTDLGYRPGGEYTFPAKKLHARHFEHENPELPRVFISELILEEFSDHLNVTFRSIIDKIPEDKLNSKELIFNSGIFGQPSYEVYERLRTESEYAAWLYAFGFRANHFTVSVNHLNGFNSIEDVNKLLKEKGFKLNSSGGEIKGSREQLLKQSSTLADIVDHDFQEGPRRIPSCYYEFAERFKDKEGKLFSGFVAGSADKIFESTDFRTTGEA